MIGPESLDFPPLHCALEPALGDYYQDLSGALELVEGGYHGGLDTAGVAVVTMGSQGTFHNAITAAQYALANMTAVRRGDAERTERARAQLDWLVESQEAGGEWEGCWLMGFDNPKYRWLKAPWTSALASGNAISALLRGRELFGEESYRAAAEAAYEALHRDRDRQRLCEESGGRLWYEEYPGDPPLHVLNGHIYALLGVLDYARVSGDPLTEQRWRRAVETVRATLPEFDLGYWSAYELRWREPATLHYQKNIHIPQLRILAALSGEPVFDEVADRWARYLASPVARARRAIALRLSRGRYADATRR